MAAESWARNSGRLATARAAVWFIGLLHLKLALERFDHVRSVDCNLPSGPRRRFLQCVSASGWSLVAWSLSICKRRGARKRTFKS
jgi:hypothetical protein